MNHRELMRRIGLREYWQVCRIINEEAGQPPHAHAQSAEARKWCAECQEWHRNFERIWEEVFGPLLEDKGQKYTENGGVVPYKKNTKEETALYARVAKRLRLKVSYVTSVARGWQKSAPVSAAIEEERIRQRLFNGES